MVSILERLKRQLDTNDGGATWSNPTPKKQAPAVTPAPRAKPRPMRPPSSPAPQQAPRSISPTRSTAFSRGLSRTFDQINPLDNGRTWKQRTPTNTRSTFEQAMHNGVTNTVGNIGVKPVANTLSFSIIEPARSLTASGTNNTQAFLAAERRKQTARENSVPGIIINQAKNGFEVAKAVPGTAGGIYRGFSGQAPKQWQEDARHKGIAALDRTFVGKLYSPALQQVANRNKDVKSDLEAAGIDTDKSLGKQFTESAMGLLSTAGGATFLKGGGSVASNIAKGDATNAIGATKQVILNSMPNPAAPIVGVTNTVKRLKNKPGSPVAMPVAGAASKGTRPITQPVANVANQFVKSPLRNLGRTGAINIDHTQPTLKNMFGEEVPNPSYKAPRKTSKQYKDAKLQAEANARAEAATPFSPEEKNALNVLSSDYVAKINGKSLQEAKQLKAEYDKLVTNIFDGKRWTDTENNIDEAVQNAYDSVRKGAPIEKTPNPLADLNDGQLMERNYIHNLQFKQGDGAQLPAKPTGQVQPPRIVPEAKTVHPVTITPPPRKPFNPLSELNDGQLLELNYIQNLQARQGAGAQLPKSPAFLERNPSTVSRGASLSIQEKLPKGDNQLQELQNSYQQLKKDTANYPNKSKTPSANNNTVTDPMQSVFDNNPVSVGETLKQRKSITEAPSAQKLPLYGTKQVSNLDKAFRSTRSIIERQGEPGKKLAGMLQEQRNIKELYVRDIEKRIPTVQKLKGKEYENFVDATQGQATPLNDRVVQAIKEWRAVHPEIRDRAVRAGLDVGDLGETYYPHFVDYDRIFKDKNTYHQALRHLVDTGQAATEEKAIELLGYARDVSRNRRFGNLEASRLVDLPFYDKSKSSLGMYIDGAVDRISKTEMFGKGDEKALSLIRESGLGGYDTEAMKNAFDVAVGAKQYNPVTSKISRNIRQFTTTTRLGLGALTNASQSVNTGIVTGHMRTLKSLAKQLDPKTRQLADDTGVISDAIINDLKHGLGAEYNKGKVGKVVGAITAPGFKQVETLNRRVAATAGRDYARSLAKKGDEATLRKLGVTGEIKNKTLTEAQEIQAARKIVEKTQFKVDPQDLPGWVDHPGGRLVAQFRTFSYNQGKFFSNEILKPMAKGNFAPLARLLAALPLGYGLYETRRAIDGRPEEENKTKIGLQSFQKVGGAGLVLDIYNGLNSLNGKYIPSDRRVSMALGTFGGPNAGLVAEATGALSEAVQRKNTPADESRLEGKVVAGKNENDYTDLTALSRFGLRQIPIAGTPLANRILPYKKQSDADTGKTASSGSPTTDTEKAFNTAYKTAFNTQEKKFRTMNNAEREKAIRDGVATQRTFDILDRRYKSLQKQHGVQIGSRPDTFTKLSKPVQSYIVSKSYIADADKDAWMKDTAKGDGQTLIGLVNQMRPEGYGDLPNTNEVAGLYADYKARQADEKWTPTRENTEKLKLLRESYDTQLDKNEAYYLKASDTEMAEALDAGDISIETFAKLVAHDDQNIKLKGSARIGNKLRNALGFPDAPKYTSSSSTARSASGKSGRTSKAKVTKITPSMYDMSSIYNTTAAHQKKLRSLLGLTRM